MVRHHDAADPIRASFLLAVHALLGERHLDGGRAPGDEVGELSLADPEEGFVHVGRVDIARDDVEAGYVGGGLGGCGGDHAVFGLEETAHDVEGGRFADGFGLGVSVNQPCATLPERERSTTGRFGRAQELTLSISSPVKGV